MTYVSASDVVAGHDLTGMNVIVTGGTSGLGAETVRVLAAAGAQVVAAGRSRGIAALPQIGRVRGARPGLADVG